MTQKTPSIHINTVEKIDLHIPFHPYLINILKHYTEEERIDKLNKDFSISPELESLSSNKTQESKLLRIIDYLSKVISVISGIAVIAFIGFLLTGKTTFGDIKIGTLLTVFSFTLIGGFVSIGGVKMFSINASLRKAKDRIERVVTREIGCPFLFIFSGEDSEINRPGNPYVCVKCPLGIDISSNQDDFLMHNCKIYPSLHYQWRKNPEADRVLHL